MQNIPVVCSTISPKYLASFVSERYGMSTDISCNLLKTGINHTYRIIEPSRISILRVYSYNWRTPMEIQEELDLLLTLRDSGISVSYPLQDKNGLYIQSVEAPEGLRYAVLFSNAEGRKLQNYEAPLHFDIGKLMARFHEHTINKRLNRISYTTEVLLHDSLDTISRFLPSDYSEMRFMIKAQKVLSEILGSADKSKLRQGIVHLDIWFDNLNIDEAGKITLFDFDFCGNGFLCLDLAYYVMQLHNMEKNVEERQRKLSSFFEGYQSLQPLSEEEKRLIPALGVSLYFFLSWSAM